MYLVNSGYRNLSRFMMNFYILGEIDEPDDDDSVINEYYTRVRPDQGRIDAIEADLDLMLRTEKPEDTYQTIATWARRDLPSDDSVVQWARRMIAELRRRVDASQALEHDGK